MTMTFVWNPLNHLLQRVLYLGTGGSDSPPKINESHSDQTSYYSYIWQLPPSHIPYAYDGAVLTWKFKPSSLLPAGTRRRPDDPASPALSWSVRACSLAFAGSQLGHVAAVLRSEANRPVGGLGHARRQRAFKYAGGARSTKVDRETLLLASWTPRERERERGREMGRRACCAKEGVKRGAWTAKEDDTLAAYVKAHGEGKWREVPQKAGK